MRISGNLTPNNDVYLEKGQIEIIPYTHWYVEEGVFDSDRVLNGWIEKLNQALANGYDGLRLTGNTFWLEKKDWNDFIDYEKEIDRVLGNYQMLALCTYCLDRCNAKEIIDVVVNHQFTLIKKNGKWGQIESSKRKKAEEQYRTLFNTIDEGFCIIEMLFDENEKPIDYIFVETNPVFEKQTGLKNAVGKRIRELAPENEEYWYEIYGKVALTGESVRYENLAKTLHRWYEVYAYRIVQPQSRKVAILFNDITERKRMEEELKQSEKQYQTLGDTIPYGVWLTDATGYCTYVSTSFLEMVDMSMEQVQKFGWMHLLPPEDVQPTVQPTIDHWLRCAQTGEDFEREHRFRTKDGSYRNVLAIGRPIKNDEGEITEWVGLNLDITERKRVEEALRESKTRFHSVLDDSQDVIYRLNVQTGRFEYIRPSTEAVVGFSPDELMALEAETSLAMIHPDDLPSMREALARLEDTGKRELEYRQLTKNGDYRWISNHMPFVKDSAGRPLYRSGNIRDVTEHKRAEEALRESEEKYRNIVETANEGIWVIGADFRTTYVNEKLAEILGYSREEMIGKYGRDFADEENKAILKQTLEERQKGISEIYELKLIRKDGSPMWMLVNTKSILDENGKFASSLGMLTDITQRKQEEHRIFRYNRILEGINRIFSDVVQAKIEEVLGNTCLSVALELTGGGIGFVNLLGDDGLLHDTAISEMGLNQCLMYDKIGHRRPPGNFVLHGLYGRVVNSGKGFFTNDPSSHPDSISVPHGHPAITSFLSVLLVLDGKTKGMLGGSQTVKAAIAMSSRRISKL